MTDQRANERPLIRLAEPGELLPGEPYRIVTRPELGAIVRECIHLTADLIDILNQLDQRRRHADAPGEPPPQRCGESAVVLPQRECHDLGH